MHVKDLGYVVSWLEAWGLAAVVMGILGRSGSSSLEFRIYISKAEDVG